MERRTTSSAVNGDGVSTFLRDYSEIADGVMVCVQYLTVRVR